MSGTSGRTSRTPFAFYDPESRSLRTSQGTFDLDSTPSSPTLPASGSMRSGALYAHRRSALPTPGSGSSSTPLLKTPTAQLAVNGGSQHPDKRKAGGHGPTLADEVEHLLPTPTATPYGSNQPPSPGAAVRPSLNSLAPTLLPTPTVADSRGTRNATARRTRVNPKVQLGWTLTDVAHSGQLLPTPTAADGDRTSATYSRGNPTLHGAVSSPPSAAGSSPLDGLHPGQLTIGDD